MIANENAGAYGSPEHVEYVLRLGDNALILGERFAERCGDRQLPEEDVALTNIALDLIGEARLLLTHAGRLEGCGRDEDTLAFLRDATEFRNATLAELPSACGSPAGAADDDYAAAIVRNLLFSAYRIELWQALSNSTDDELAAIAADTLHKARCHFRHAADWTVAFSGAAESHARAQNALDILWPYTHELFETDQIETAVARYGIGVESATLLAPWSAAVLPIMVKATLRTPDDTAFRSTGKLGSHTAHLGDLLAESSRRIASGSMPRFEPRPADRFVSRRVASAVLR